MDPLYFGDSARPLFGQRHRSQGKARATSILICPPWGPEYMRSYRGLRRLAEGLSAAGFETLRFDYSGTGDSEGIALAARLEHWQADICTAARELRELSEAPKLAVLGLRLGALLAGSVQSALGSSTPLIAWDAPDSGVAFTLLMRHHDVAVDATKNARRNRNARLTRHEPYELCGHAWPEALAEALAGLPALALNAQGFGISSADHVGSYPLNYKKLHLSQPSHWQDERWISTAWMPVQAIDAVVAAVSELLP